ncbi:hypothetical protein DUI87_23029 [Hirundo rustica rustica]|uniref:Uncharacterized protein n=1 Tax=Hirundo rustica rustica TaxID=333673 RepID=A0A3M0JJC0_HIRRU|nr:hypothetical protein DUI87_23029 [Hirundo rustica rustica]
MLEMQSLKKGVRHNLHHCRGENPSKAQLHNLERAERTAPTLMYIRGVLKHLNVLPKLRGPELDTAPKVWPHQCRVQRKNDLPTPADHTIPFCLASMRLNLERSVLFCSLQSEKLERVHQNGTKTDLLLGGWVSIPAFLIIENLTCSP